jgi:D-tyrosyl-tRNA(Tyr) deacylase
MKAVVQRVTQSSVSIDNNKISEIANGLLVLLGVGDDDTQKDADFLAEKIINLRIFEDDQGKMNISLKDIKGQLMVVSQFTLHGDCRKGRRPSFIKAARPEMANELYEYFVKKTRSCGIDTKTGVFQAMMDVGLVNSGPVTLILDTKAQ